MSTQEAKAGKHPRILLVVGGGIAAYKACELVRLIRKGGGDVTCVVTKGGQQFVTPMSLAALSENQVYTSLFDLKNEAEMGHIQLSREADLVVVCPATADLLAKMASGISDSLATTVLRWTLTALYAHSLPVMLLTRNVERRKLLIVLFGLKHGVMEGLRSDLIENPRSRMIVNASNRAFDAAFFRALRERPDIAFAIPRTRTLNSHTDALGSALEGAQVNIHAARDITASAAADPSPGWLSTIPGAAPGSSSTSAHAARRGSGASRPGTPRPAPWCSTPGSTRARPRPSTPRLASGRSRPRHWRRR